MLYTNPTNVNTCHKSPFINNNLCETISHDIDKHLTFVDNAVRQIFPPRFITYAITIYESIMADSIGVTEEELKQNSLNKVPFRIFLVEFKKNEEEPFIAQSYLFSGSKEDRIDQFCSIMVNSKVINEGNGSNLLKLYNFVIEYCISNFIDMDSDTDYRDPYGFKSFIFDTEVTLSDIMFILSYMTIHFKHLMKVIDHTKITCFKDLKDMNISPTFEILSEDIMDIIWEYSKMDYSGLAIESDYVKLCKDVYNKLQMR